MARARRPSGPKDVEALRHDHASRLNIPTAEFQSIMRDEDKSPVRIAYQRRNRDLDPQLVWRGKDEQDWSDLVVHAPPLYIQEKIHPKALIDDLVRETNARRAAEPDPMPDLFADFNNVQGGPDAATDFYRHDQNWSNRMILGDSLQVMASLAERESLRGKVQCIYLDPPYGIKFNSNFQWSTTSRDVKDGKADHITREPEQVKAFRDTWRDGIHSYLTHLRDRLTVARDLLTDSGSIFVQIGDENVHRVRALMDEVFGDDNFISEVSVQKTASQGSGFIGRTNDYILWYSKDRKITKFRQLFKAKTAGGEGAAEYKRVETADWDYRPATKAELDDLTELRLGDRIFATYSLFSAGTSANAPQEFSWISENGPVHIPCTPGYHFKFAAAGLKRVALARRLLPQQGQRILKRYLLDFAYSPVANLWTDTRGETDMTYVVQTSGKIVERCMLMTTDPGDLVLDPTCGSGTTAFVAEQWGRRWITIDTSRVALALARARLTGARYPYYLLADSPEGQHKEAEVTRSVPKSAPTRGDIRQGFVYERAPNISLESISKNAEIEVIWERFQAELEPLRAELNAALGEAWEEWQIPRLAETPWNEKTAGLLDIANREIDRGEKGDRTKLAQAIAAINHNLGRDYTRDTLPKRAVDPWPPEIAEIHAAWWEKRIARQQEIDASIAAKADTEYLYDKPYVDPGRVRVAGPFTVESLSPHRTLAVDENDDLQEPHSLHETGAGKWIGDGVAIDRRDFTAVIMEQLRSAGVQFARKDGRIRFVSLEGWPGEMICAEGRYQEAEDGPVRRAGILIGPEFGTVAREDLVKAAREAGDAGFDVLVACAFNFDAHATDFEKLGRLPIIKARMNPDLHMADELKDSKGGNLFVVFGEPDIEISHLDDGRIEVELIGVDVFHPTSGKVVSSGPDEIAIWFIDTDYNEESFFVRHAYFPGTAHDPMKALKTTLKAEIDEEAWASLNRTVSRPFAKPSKGRIAVKVINHLGDEVMKVFRA